MHGLPITGTMDIDWHALCEELLGVRLTETDIRGASIRVRFITVAGPLQKPIVQKLLRDHYSCYRYNY